MRTFLILLALLFTLGATGPARAAASAEDKATAEALFDEALRLLQAGDAEAACPKLEQSQRIDPGIGTLLYLGDCYERTGKTASAWATFREAASTADAAGQTERAVQGRERAARLENKLSRLTVTVVGPSVEGLVVTRGGTKVPSAVFGSALPTDPGEHVIEATAPGYKPYRTTVDVPDNAGSASVEIPALVAAPAASTPAAPPPRPASPAASGSASLKDSDPSDTEGASTASLVLFGVSALGVGVGSYFGLQAFAKDRQAKRVCDGTMCPQDGIDRTDEAKQAALISNISFGVGALALAGGLYLHFSADDDEASAGLAPRALVFDPVQGGGQLTLQGSF